MQSFIYYIKEAWRGLWFHRALTINSLLALIGALIIPGVFLVIVVNTMHSFQTVGDRREMIAFLVDDIPDSTLKEMVSSLDPGARSITLVSKEEAWEEMKTELGDSGLLEAVEENPLPASLRIRLRPEYQSFERMDSIATILDQNENVEEVQFGARAVQIMDRLFGTFRWIGLSLAVVIALVVLFVVANTIRLTIVARRDLLHTMSVLGAGGMFIRLPLILEGVIACLLASVISLGLIYGLYLLLEPRLVILPSFLPIPWMAAFVGAAAGLGVIGSVVGMLRLDTGGDRG